MIVYFSAEGNSKHVATELAQILGDKAIHISKCNPKSLGSTLIIVCPIYCWGIPVPVKEWVKRINGSNISYCATVLTCGDDIGYADRMMAELLAEKGVTLDCCISIQMPNSYVILPGFDVDKKSVKDEKLKAAIERIAYIGDCLHQKARINDVVTGSMPLLKTKLLYPIFLKMGISTRKFNTTDACIGCGKCADVCVRHNISMTTGESPRPKWGEDCVSCLACYHHCPVHALQYGFITRKKGQYTHPSDKTE